MSDQSPIDAASRRLAFALDALEAALERRREADHGEAGLAAQLQTLSSDRSKLAAELDRNLARARKLETANSDIAQRLDSAIHSIKAMIDGQKK
jgi:hypothetical protein